jgi:hypothetical protein
MMFTSRPRICTAVIVPCPVGKSWNFRGHHSWEPMDLGSSDDWSIGPLFCSWKNMVWTHESGKVWLRKRHCQKEAS